MAEGYDDEQLCIICLASCEGVGSVSIHKLLDGARAKGMELRKAMRLPAGELAREFGLVPKVASVVCGVESPLLGAEAIMDVLERMDARVVLEGDHDYPARLRASLGPAAPPVLFVQGDPELLRAPTVAVVGSREPSRAAAAAAFSFAAQQAAHGVVVVSGGAAGIDTAGHRGAIGSGGTVVIPATGIGRFAWRDITDEHLEGGRWCVVGQFPPLGRWEKSYALIRNRTVIAAADSVVAFEPRDTGGTRHASMTALRMRKPLFVASARESAGHRRGMDRLVRLGAEALDTERMPEPDAFEQLVREYRPPSQSAQLPLFDPLEDVR